MGDQAELWNDIKAERRERRARLGVNCPTCTVQLPKAHPTILLPKQRCKVCGYVDPRERERRCKTCGKPEQKFALGYTDFALGGHCADCINRASREIKASP